MAKGQVAKATIFNKILNSFEGAFPYNDGKELRIPMQENGEEIQIKVALTCAKDNVAPGDDNALPGTKASTVKAEEQNFTFNNNTEEKSETHIEPTAEEKANVKSMLEFLGL